MKRLLLLLLPATLLVGCAPSPWKQLSQGERTEDLLQALAPPLAEESVSSPQPEMDWLPQKTPAPFRRLPNPDFVLYFLPRLAENSIVPAYQTRLHLYLPPAPWALPGEAVCAGCPPR